MAQKKKMALPPNQNFPTPEAIDEAAMKEMIARGGDVPKVVSEEKEDKLKSLTFQIYESDLSRIRKLIKNKPEPGVKYHAKKAKSMAVFVAEAVLEKISNEEAK